jgi:hypothetical protein
MTLMIDIPEYVRNMHDSQAWKLEYAHEMYGTLTWQA